MSKKIVITVSDEMEKSITVLAKSKGIKVTELLKHLIVKEIEDHEQGF